MFIDMQDIVHNDGASVLNGQGRGEIGSTLADVRFEPGFLRPYMATAGPNKGQRCVSVHNGRMKYHNGKGVHFPVRSEFTIEQLRRRGVNVPVNNATSLRKEAWIELDKQVLLAARFRLRAWADLAAASSFGGFDGMAKMTLEYEVQSDPHEAIVDLDGLSPGRGDSPLYKLRSLPLPITHSDFWYSERRLAQSRNTSTPLDATSGEAAGRRVAEMIEKLTIGVETGLTYGTQTAGYGTHDGTSTIYGYTNLSARITKTNLTVPTGSNPEATVADVLAMRSTMYLNKFYGPFMIYHSTDWDRFLDNDYARLGGSNSTMTLRDRLRKIEDVQDVRRLDYLNETTNPYTLIMVRMTSETARAVNGMEITTVQWPSQGNMRQNFKVMCIQVPQLRYDYNGVAAILHATTS